MSIFKKSATAKAICTVVCVLSLLLGIHLSVNRQLNKLDDSFENGVYSKESGYTLPSVQAQLDDRYNAALGIITLIPSDLADELRSACNELKIAETVNDKYKANVDLQNAYEAMLKEVDTASFDERTLTGFTGYCSVMENAQYLIESSGYNEAVAEFETDILGSFPLSILKYPAFAGTPEYFGN